MRLLASGFLVLVVMALAACKEAPIRDCKEFEAAERLLDQISNTTLDPTFGDARYAPALAAFEAIPQDCKQHGSAVTIADTIRTAMAKRKTEEESSRAQTAAPVVPAVPPPSSSSEGERTAAEVAEYFRKIETVPPAPDGSDGKAYLEKLMAEAFESEEAAEELDAWVARAEREMQAISVPEPCREFHAALQENLRASDDLWEELHKAIEAEDRTALVEIKARRQKLKADEQRLEQMKVQIKQKYRVR